MFKKRFKFSNQHSLANKDRKNLAQAMTKLGYDEEKVTFLLKDKNYEGEEDEESEMMIQKIQGSRVTIYYRGGTPYLFTPDLKIGPTFPSMYALF